MPKTPPKSPTGNQLKFLNTHEVGRLAVADKEGMPHVTPIVYVMDDICPIIATEYGTRKLKILQENNKASLVVDDVSPNEGVMIQGTVEILERGEEYLRLLKLLFEKIAYYREDQWGEGESPLLRITPERFYSWAV
jgi:nitroimidazol reductase NimA-like FMN-containing flavoprotein (pyridoxamine 5'-phosphate oxidase superfamily)